MLVLVSRLCQSIILCAELKWECHWGSPLECCWRESSVLAHFIYQPSAGDSITLATQLTAIAVGCLISVVSQNNSVVPTKDLQGAMGKSWHTTVKTLQDRHSGPLWKHYVLVHFWGNQVKKMFYDIYTLHLLLCEFFLRMHLGSFVYFLQTKPRGKDKWATKFRDLSDLTCSYVSSPRRPWLDAEQLQRCVYHTQLPC